jgi:hypothetical protein
MGCSVMNGHGFSEFFGKLMTCDFASCAGMFFGMPSILPCKHVAVMFCWCLLPLRCASNVEWDVPLAWHVLQLHFIEDIFFCSAANFGF